MKKMIEFYQIQKSNISNEKSLFWLAPSAGMMLDQRRRRWDNIWYKICQAVYLCDIEIQKKTENYIGLCPMNPHDMKLPDM